MHETPPVVNPLEAGLLLKFGGSGQRWRPLERDILVIGRVHGCDLVLNSPEISQVHCVLSRHMDGWWIRDCGSRAGTRVNGKRVQESRLADGDTLQLAVFSFEAHLPGRTTGGRSSSSRLPIIPHELEKLRKGRRRLIRLGLRYRRRMIEQYNQYIAAEPSLEERAEALHQQEMLFQTRVRECASRALKMEQAEREMAIDRETLDRDFAQFQQHVEQKEHELRCRLAEAEAKIQQLEVSEEHCQEPESASA